MQRGLWLLALLAAALSVGVQGQGASAFDKAERDAIAEMCTATHAACGAPFHKRSEERGGQREVDRRLQMGNAATLPMLVARAATALECDAAEERGELANGHLCLR